MNKSKELIQEIKNGIIKEKLKRMNDDDLNELYVLVANEVEYRRILKD